MSSICTNYEDNVWLAERKSVYDEDLHCHDLAKWLSHYLYFFSFLFFFFYLRLTTQKGVQESVTSQVSHSHNHMTGSHNVTSHNVTQMGHMIGMAK